MKIVFDQVDKNFGLITALSNVSFTIDQGEFVFIVGHSGAGKSTILKLLLNQIKPTHGQIIIDNIDLSRGHKNEIDSIRRQIGVIFQDYQLIMDKSVEENIALSLDIINYPHSKISAKIDEVIKQVDLNSRRYLFPAQLSGGELQRAALARALAIEPKIILADEPTGNLDVENSWNLVKLLKNINESSHTTIIMTTHNQEIVDSLDKRRLEIKDGRIIKDFTPGVSVKPVTAKKNINSTKK
ncbi:MAG TPA: ATP-binding cassette domain-containing protein [Candidatus Woesebacteria bacterium]|jgi:cell division transport system ATP-binding protein|nr:ATP-binding cassette domain-containing protein [Candidatus Shapirobacteria bacterium]HOR02063.1 ATP-binding cassette domain-containing protein [Candidatus Woesebacteria bacterium]